MAAMASSKGSTFISMPGPPPTGRSSTVRRRSWAWSRGLLYATVHCPRLTARPPGHSVPGQRREHLGKQGYHTGPHRSELRIPVDLHDTLSQVDVLYVQIRQVRQQPFALVDTARTGLYHQDIIGSGLQQMID